MLLSAAIRGYLIDKAAGGLSPSTAKLYQYLLAQFLEWLGDKELAEIKDKNLSMWMAYLRTDYQPRRAGVERLGGYMLDNHWKAQRSFWKWANSVLEVSRPDNNLVRPKFAQEEIIPFTEEEMQKILAAAEYSKEAKTAGRKPFRMKRPTSLRDKALFLLLLDTGIRLGELVRLRIADVNLTSSEIRVRGFGSGVKSRPRSVPIEKTCRRALWFYLEKERSDSEPNENLFDLEARSVQSLLRRIEKRSGVPGVHAHRFRHTFAIEFLRNGGDIFTLQKLLGHSSLEMVRRYLSIAQADVQAAHKRASPVERWRLRG